MADVSFPRLEASCSHPLASRLAGTGICMECLPPDRLRQGDTVFFRGDTDSAALPRPLGEQLVEGFTRILGTPREPEDQARQLAQFILLEFDIMRRVIT